MLFAPTPTAAAAMVDARVAPPTSRLDGAAVRVWRRRRRRENRRLRRGSRLRIYPASPVAAADLSRHPSWKRFTAEVDLDERLHRDKVSPPPPARERNLPGLPNRMIGPPPETARTGILKK